MFTIKIETDFKTHLQSSKFYFIKYERIPVIADRHTYFNQSEFTNKKEAFKVASDLSKYLTQSFFFLDCIYTKIKLCELSHISNKQFLKINFNHFEQSRVELINSSKSDKCAWEHIEKFSNFIHYLKKVCFALSKDFTHLANNLFSLLLDFEESFKKTYLSSATLSESNQLKFFF